MKGSPPGFAPGASRVKAKRRDENRLVAPRSSAPGGNPKLHRQGTSTGRAAGCRAHTGKRRSARRVPAHRTFGPCDWDPGTGGHRHAVRYSLSGEGLPAGTDRRVFTADGNGQLVRYFLTGRQPLVHAILLVESGSRGLLG